MVNHVKISCPECLKADGMLMRRSNTMQSRDFIDHIIINHDKKYHRWFKQWSGEFFKHNPEFLIYLGVENKNYRAEAF